MASRKIRGQPQRLNIEQYFLREDFVRRTHFLEWVQGLQESRFDDKDFFGLHGSLTGQKSHHLETDEKMTAGRSIEIRYPFLDRRLIEFCAGIPAGQLLRNGWTRSIERRSMSGLLPPDIQKRSTKVAADASINRAALLYDRAGMEDIIFTNPKSIEPYVDIAALQRAYERFTKGEADLTLIWRPLTLARWLLFNDFSSDKGAKK